MSDARQQRLFGIFERAAEELGDITQPVMQRAYADCPEALACFERHGLGEKLQDLEAVMVEQTLYCVLAWEENPGAARITLETTIPHHAETLEVPLPFFWSIFEALFDELAERVIGDRADELQDWQALHGEIEDYVRSDIAPYLAATTVDGEETLS